MEVKEIKEFSSLAFGGRAQIGDLFDCTSHNFIGHSIFNQEIPNSAIISTENIITNCHFVPSESFHDKTAALGLKDELIVNVIADQSEFLGCGKYLQDVNPSSTTRISLIHTIKTSNEKFKFTLGDMKNISIDSLKMKNVTHVLTQIQWGAITVITAETEEKPQELAELNLKAQMNKIIRLLMENGKLDSFQDLDDSTNSFKIFSDLLAEQSIKLETIKSALEFLTKIPNLLKKANDGKGKQISYHFEPVNQLKKYIEKSGKATLEEMNYFQTFQPLHKSTILNLVKFHDEITSEKSNIEDFLNKMRKLKSLINKNDYDFISNHKASFQIERISLYTNLKELIIKVRLGTKNDLEIANLLSNYKKRMIPFEITLNQVIHVQDKILSFENALFKYAMYLERGRSLEDKISELLNCEIFVLFYSSELQKQNPSDWELNHRVFVQLFENHDNKIEKSKRKFIVVDYIIHPVVKSGGGKIKISQFQNGIRTHSNFAKKFEVNETKSICISSLIEKNTELPINRVALSMPCPNKNCSQDDKTWHCHSCYGVIFYGFDNYFYCLCGRSKICNEFAFNCKMTSHGNSFLKFENNSKIKHLVNNLKAEEMNILILGKTGTGKSTWINSFANIISYDNFELAEKNKLFSPIPSEFTMCDEKFIQRRINTGIDENECTEKGKSATQNAKEYLFNNGKSIIRLIDTPGIGDTRGLVQDKENFLTTFKTMAKYKEVHGILILLNPNEARLDLMFEFCIKELLAILHKDAIKNIVFVFTNTRGTLYRPGETLSTLQTFLANSKVKISLQSNPNFCMDSESFRYLAAIKNSIKFSKTEQKSYKASWKKSKTQVDRLINHIGTLDPHPTFKTLSINAARNQLEKFSAEVSEMSHKIKTSEETIKRKNNEIQKLESEKLDFEKYGTIKQYKVETNPLGYPVTVCGNSNCTTLVKYNGMNQIDYRTICHTPCVELQSVRLNTVGEAQLMNCHGMVNYHCRTCGHSYQEHLHINYTSKQVEETSTGQNPIWMNGVNADITKAKDFIKQLEKNIEELKEEQMKIEIVLAQWEVFLKENAIILYNDSLIHYLVHLINEENSAAAMSGDYGLVNALTKLKANYTEQFRILDREVKVGGDSCIDAIEIEALVKSLYLHSLHRSESTSRLAKMEDLDFEGNRRICNIQDFSFGSSLFGLVIAFFFAMISILILK